MTVTFTKIYDLLDGKSPLSAELGITCRANMAEGWIDWSLGCFGAEFTGGWVVQRLKYSRVEIDQYWDTLWRLRVEIMWNFG